ncbi:MAG TPA: protein DpdH [Armatimonadota bacterium]|jgi:hypothetical protein
MTDGQSTSFENHVCWKTERIPRVMDTEALQVEDDVFLAVHSPMRMRQANVIAGETGGPILTQEGFRSAFLDADKNHVLAMVQGWPGSGKSHLIRWLSVTTPRTADRHIVLVPRANTNLKKVVELILEGMEGATFDALRDRLRQTSNDLSPALARELLLSHLAIAVGPNGPRSGDEQLTGEAAEAREELVEELPALLNDAAFRRPFLAEGSIVDQLARHAVGRTDAERQESRRQFTTTDLALDRWQLNIADLGKKARNVYGSLRSETYRQTVVDWMNRNLDAALRQMLNLGREDVNDLLFQVRETLATQGRELVLLIEDFARLQGIDQPLLEAVLVRPVQGDRRLCVLRTAMAVTPGFYAVLKENVRDRVDLAVNLDLEGVGVHRVITRGDLAAFAARYLNAVRVNQGELKEWAVGSQQAEPPSSPPNACLRCPHQEVCHRTFGNGKEYGVYPFTESALDEMFRRAVESREHADYFSPRVLIDHVLKHVLAHDTEALREGRFPPTALLTHFGRGRMPASKEDQLKRRVPADMLGRYRTVYELWGNPEQLGGVPDGVFRGFGLKPLEDNPGEAPSYSATERDPEPTVVERDKPIHGQREPLPGVKELDAWANGGHLSPDLSKDLRTTLFEATVAYIDWDAEMLAQDAFVGDGRLFKRLCINIQRQSTQVSQATISVILPLAGWDNTQTAIALQGLVQHQLHRHWQFEEGARYQRAYARLLSDISKHVLSQIRDLPTGSGWDPLSSAVELLAIGARLRGRITSTSEPEKQIDSLFAPWEGESIPDFRSPVWKALLRDFVELGDKVSRIVKARASCTKGGALPAQIVDAGPLLSLLKKTVRLALPSTCIPSPLPSEYSDIERLRKKVDDALETAVVQERARYFEWRDTLRRNVSEGTSQTALASAVEKVLHTASGMGVVPALGGMPEPRALIDSAKEFAAIPLGPTLEAMNSLSSTSQLNEWLDILGRDDLHIPMEKTRRFLDLLGRVLTATEDRVIQDIQHTSGGATLGGEEAAIRTGFDTLVDLCSMIAQEDAHAS